MTAANENAIAILTARVACIAALRADLERRIGDLNWLGSLWHGGRLKRLIDLSNRLIADADARLDKHEAELLELSAILAQLERACGKGDR